MKRCLLWLFVFSTAASGDKIKDIATVAGLRPVHLTGMGIVTGLDGDGDSSDNTELQKRLATVFRRFSGDRVQLKKVATDNVALVSVTATVPSYTKTGQSFTVTVSSVGDAKSLKGGNLLMCPLRGPTTPGKDGDTFIRYAVTQGKVTVSGDVETVGSAQALLEKELGIPIRHHNEYITLCLKQPDFNVASEIASAINNFELFSMAKTPLAHATDVGTVRVRIPASYLRKDNVVDFIAVVLGQIEVPSPSGGSVVVGKDNNIVISGKVQVTPFSAFIGGKKIMITSPGPLHEVIDKFTSYTGNGKKTEFLTELVPLLKQMKEAGALKGKLVIQGQW